MKRMISLGVALSSLMCSLAFAAPPTDVRGVDLAAVLAFMDRARQLDVKDSKRFAKIQTIVIDPGHGGENQGALGVANVHEKYLTLELAYALRKRIQQEFPGTRVILTRYWDVTIGLPERIALANEVQADLFLSLHYNAATHDRAQGHETYFLRAHETIPGEEQRKGEPVATAGPIETVIEEPAIDRRSALEVMEDDLRRQTQHVESGLLAQAINSSLAEHLQAVNRGVKQANFGVLRGATMPAVVVEAAFVSHPREGKLVVQEEHRETLVDALFQAVINFDDQLLRKNGP